MAASLSVRTIIISRYLFLFFLIFQVSCRQAEEVVYESLEEVKSFRPEDEYFKSSLVSLHFVIETRDIATVDTFFDQMLAMFELPSHARAVPDGKYRGESPYDAFDFRHVVEIEVKAGQIAGIDYNEIHSSGWGKEENEAYCDKMSISGTTPAIAYPAMEKQMLDKQDYMKVDAVSGASYSLYRFRYALAVALMNGLLKE